MRDMRKHLSPSLIQQASVALKDQLVQLPELEHANKVALYLANDGELDPKPSIDWLLQQDIQVYVPVLHPFSKGQLLFLHLTEETPLVTNRYGISEPKLDVQHICPARELDIIFTPLVAFDNKGHRLGMGGGYYDRTLASFRDSHKPEAIGLAFDEQQLDTVPVESWDMPMQKILTPSKTWRW